MLRPLFQPVFEHGKTRPHVPAIGWTGGSLSYGELAAEVRSVAARLVADGCRPGDRIAIGLPKSAESVILILATLSAGAVYVPVDHRLPPARFRRILDLADPCRAFVSPRLRRRLMSEGWAGAVDSVDCALDGDGLRAFRATPDASSPDLSLDDLAALLFTSGSTGDPKGVMLSHRNIGTFADWAVRTFDIVPEDRLTSHAPFHFDLSTLDLYGAFSAGASIRLLSENEVLFPAAVANILADERITVWYSVPTALALLVERGAIGRRDLTSLRTVLFAGERYPIEGVRALRQMFPGVRLANLYGPTESNVCTWYEVPRNIPADLDEVPIGRPCDYAEVWLDGAEPGEICVAGSSVMLGYWRRPEETAAVRADGRADSYRTGDRGSWLPDGNLRFHGRGDRQIKLRGYRIELDEIERTIAMFPGVREAAVELLEKEEAIVAAVVGDVEAELVGDSILRFCAESLPSYACPARISLFDDLPRLVNGKLDRRRISKMMTSAEA